MKVEKQSLSSIPAYPSRREFSHYHLLAGLAVVGLGAIAGRAGDTPRLTGDVVEVPRIQRSSLKGAMPADGRSGATTNANQTATNAVSNACSVTNAPVPVLPGKPPAEPRSR